MSFNERWLQPGGIVPVDIPTTGELIREIQRLRALVSPEGGHDAARLDWLQDELKVTIAHALQWPAIPQDRTSWRAALDAAMSTEDK